MAWVARPEHRDLGRRNPLRVGSAEFAFWLAALSERLEMRREPLNRGCVIQQMHQKEKAYAEKKALLDQLSKPSGISDEEALKRAAAIIQRALKNGLTEVESTLR